MPNAAIARLIAEKLPTLTHPGDGSGGAIALPMPMLRASGIPPEMAERFAAEAGYPNADITELIGEAIVALIEGEGQSTIVANAELTEMRAAQRAAEPLRHRQVAVSCNCGVHLFTAMIRDWDLDRARVAGPELIKALRLLGPECATAHKLAG